MGLIPACCWNICFPRTFCVTLSPFVDWQSCFIYIAALSIISSFLNFVKQYRTDRDLTLYNSFWLPLFGALGVGQLAQTLPHVRAWLLGSDYSCCIASEQKCLKRFSHYFSLSCWKYWKNSGSGSWFWTLIPQTGVEQTAHWLLTRVGLLIHYWWGLHRLEFA